jgi:hypothetical protein
VGLGEIGSHLNATTGPNWMSISGNYDSEESDDNGQFAHFRYPTMITMQRYS